MFARSAGNNCAFTTPFYTWTTRSLDTGQTPVATLWLGMSDSALSCYLLHRLRGWGRRGHWRCSSIGSLVGRRCQSLQTRTQNRDPLSRITSWSLLPSRGYWRWSRGSWTAYRRRKLSARESISNSRARRESSLWSSNRKSCRTSRRWKRISTCRSSSSGRRRLTCFWGWRSVLSKRHLWRNLPLQSDTKHWCICL